MIHCFSPVLRFLIALAPVRDLFLFAKHLFVAARRHIIFANHFSATTLLPLRKTVFTHPLPPAGVSVSTKSMQWYAMARGGKRSGLDRPPLSPAGAVGSVPDPISRREKKKNPTEKTSFSQTMTVKKMSSTSLIPILRLSDLRLPNRGGRWT